MDRRQIHRRHIGAGFWDFMIVMAVLAAAFLIYQKFFASQPPPAAAPVAVQSAPAPAPQVVVPAPAPAVVVKPQVVAVSAPATTRPLLVVAPPEMEPVPEVVIAQRDLMVAQEASEAAEKFIAREQRACEERFEQSPEYLQANADVDAKRAAKEAAISKYHEDDSAGMDTDADEQNVRTTSTDWINAAANLTAMENQALENDATLVEKKSILTSATADVARYSKAMNDEVTKLVLANADDPECAVKSVKVNPATWTIEATLVPQEQNSVSMMNDAAVIQIGNTLENVLYQSPFMWTMAKFTVYVDYAGKPEVEFQARYRRSEVDKANFAQLDRQVFDDQGLLNLADTVWLSPVVDEMQG